VTFVLRKTTTGRRFEAVEANPDAVRATGIETIRYQAGAYIAAAFLCGVMAVLISGFIRNPTLVAGAPYVSAPIAAAVLGATSINGGIGSMIAVLGAALFLTQLGQQLRPMGLETSFQMIIQGVAIAIGMWLSGWWERRRQSMA
jgi:ribose transport system permease protein